MSAIDRCARHMTTVQVAWEDIKKKVYYSKRSTIRRNDSGGPKPTIPRVKLERGRSLLAAQAPSTSRPMFNPPLAQHSDDVRFRQSRRATQQGQQGQSTPAKIVNHRCPCLSQVGANQHHVPFASSACRTRMPPPQPRALVPVVVVGSQGQIGRRRRG
jgi:hypothetical protein